MSFKFNILFAFLLLILFSLSSFSTKAYADNNNLSGSVKDSSGNSIVGATVTISDTNNDSTTTDSSGNYSFSVQSGTYNVQATPPGGSGFSSAIALGQNISSNTILNFVLTPAGSVTLSGHIYDPQGNPLPNQKISLNTSTSQNSLYTDSSGSYSLQVTAGTYELDINSPDSSVGSNNSLNAPQFYSLTVPNYSLTQSTIADFTLPVKKVDLHVQDTAGNPVSNVVINTQGFNTDGISIGEGFTAQARSAYGIVSSGLSTDASGNVTLWLFPNSSNTPYTFTATPPSGTNLAATTLSNINITGDTQKTITLPSSVTLSGHVYDSSGNPVPNQGITLGSKEVVTDSTGSYSMQVAAGTYPLSVNPFSQNGCCATVPENYNLNVPNYTITSDSTLDITIPAVKTIVHVQDSQGNPVENVQINAVGGFQTNNTLSIGGDLLAQGNAQYASGPQTDASGNATLWLIPNDSQHHYTLTAVPPSESSFGTTTIPVDITSATQETITLPTPVTLSGHVYDSSGNPLPNQKIFLNTSTSQNPVYTDSSGSYSLQVTAGTYELDINSPDPSVGSNNSLNVPQFYNLMVHNYSLTQNTIADFTLPAKKVNLHVQDSAGNPVSNVIINTQGFNTDGINIGSNILAQARSGYGIVSPGLSTNSSGNVTLWLFPNDSSHPYTFTAVPPNGSIYSSFNLNNITVAGDQNELVSLQYNHSTPVTTASLSPSSFSDGTYADPTTVILSAAAADGYTVANTYYTVDDGTQQTYSSPFTLTGAGNHTITYWSVDNSGVIEATNIKTVTITEVYNLTGKVYNDANQNGFQDSGELGIAGATVMLNTGQSIITNSNGNYTFSNLESGTYAETLTVPSGYIATTTNPVSVPLAANTTENFGIVVPVPTATLTPTQAPTTTVTFDDINPVSPLTGIYKGINWGTTAWDVDSSISTDTTHSGSFHSSGVNSETFSFTSPQVLISTGVYSNSNQSALVTVSCSGNPTASQVVTANSTATLITNWATACTTVTVTSSNGWNTNIDNIVYSASSSPTVTSTPTPSGQILGNNNIGSQIDTGDSGFMNGTKFTTSAIGGTAQSMSVFVNTIDNAAHSQYQMAIYTDNNGTPGTLVAQTATGNLTALSWNTLPITATLTANTTYWLMYNNNGRVAQDLNNMYYTPGSAGKAAFAKHAFGSWPTNYPTATFDTPNFSIYVTYQ